MSLPNLNGAIIARLAEAQGIPLADADMAERIAAGAGAAIAVVREQLAAGWPGLPGDAGDAADAAADAAAEAAGGNPVCDYEPGEFLATLERLADVPAASPAPAPQTR